MEELLEIMNEYTMYNYLLPGAKPYPCFQSAVESLSSTERLDNALCLAGQYDCCGDLIYFLAGLKAGCESASRESAGRESAMLTPSKT